LSPVSFLVLRALLPPHRFFPQHGKGSSLTSLKIPDPSEREIFLCLIIFTKVLRFVRSVVVSFYDLITQEAEARVSQVQGHPGLHKETLSLKKVCDCTI
jgi:hypothetical protein